MLKGRMYKVLLNYTVEDEEETSRIKYLTFANDITVAEHTAILAFQEEMPGCDYASTYLIQEIASKVYADHE